MARPVPPPSWRVSETPNDDGTVTVRFAYSDGTAANMVIPAHGIGVPDDLTLAGWVKRPPPPPSRP